MPALSVAELSSQVRAQRERLNYSNEPLCLLALLMEEMGELAQSLKPTWSNHYGSPKKSAISQEFGDCMIVLFALADSLDVDLQHAVLDRLHGRLIARPSSGGPSDE